MWAEAERQVLVNRLLLASSQSVLNSLDAQKRMLETKITDSFTDAQIDAAKKTVDTGDAFKDYTIEKKNQAVAHGKKLLRDIDGKLKQFEGQAAKSGGEVKAAAQEQLKELKAKRKDVSAKLDEMGKASAASWDSVKNGFVDAYKDLSGTYDKAVAKLK